MEGVKPERLLMAGDTMTKKDIKYIRGRIDRSKKERGFLPLAILKVR